MPYSLFTQERGRKTEYERCMQINGRQLRVTINRQNHLNAMRNHLRQSNLKALEVNIHTKERKRKSIEELSKKIRVKLNEAFCRRQMYHFNKLRRLQCTGCTGI